MVLHGKYDKPYNEHFLRASRELPLTGLYQRHDALWQRYPSQISGGGILHRGGTAETILLFANHRRFCTQPDDWTEQIRRLKREAPEKKIIVEAGTVDEAILALEGQPDILQLDKFSVENIALVMQKAGELAPLCLISIAGGINKSNIHEFAKTGVSLIVTSAPYYAEPTDIKVILQPLIKKS